MEKISTQTDTVQFNFEKKTIFTSSYTESWNWWSSDSLEIAKSL